LNWRGFGPVPSLLGEHKKYYFKGIAKWAKLAGEPVDEEFTYKGKKINKKASWSIDLYMDEPSMAAFKKSDIQLKPRNDKESGEEYVQFHRFVEMKIKDKETGEDKIVKLHPPKILNEANEEIDTLVGNGSEVTISVDVYKTRMGPGSRLEAVRVENLVEYDKNKVSEDTPVEMPF
jgi:hypothetical protein